MFSVFFCPQYCAWIACNVTVLMQPFCVSRESIQVLSSKQSRRIPKAKAFTSFGAFGFMDIVCYLDGWFLFLSTIYHSPFDTKHKSQSIWSTPTLCDFGMLLIFVSLGIVRQGLLENFSHQNLMYSLTTQNTVGINAWQLRPNIMIHVSCCQFFWESLQPSIIQSTIRLMC